MTEIILISTLAGAAASYPLLKWGVSREESLEKIEKTATRYALPASLAMTAGLLFMLYTPAYIAILSVIGALAAWVAVQIRERFQSKKNNSLSVLMATEPSSEVSKDLTQRRRTALNGFLFAIVAAVLMTESHLADIPGFVAHNPETAVFISGDRGIPGMIESLNSRDTTQRAQAALTLIRLGQEELLIEMGAAAVPALIAALEYKGSPGRFKAEDILLEIGSPAVPALIQALEDRWNLSHIEIARILGRMGAKRAVPALLNTIRHGNIGSQKWAIAALGQIKDTSAIPHLIRILNSPLSPDPQTGAMMSAADVDLRWAVMNALGEIGHPSAVPAIIPWLKVYKTDLRLRAAKSLGMIGNASALPALIEVLKGDDLVLHLDAAEAIGKIGGGEAVRALTDALSHKDINVRMKIVSALGETRDGSASSILLDLVNGEKNVEMRWIVVLALGRLGDKSQLPSLLTALQDRNPVVQRAAVIALGEHRDDRAVFPLIEVVRNSTDQTKMEAVKALGKIGNPGAVPALIDYLKYNNDLVRAEAARSLGDIKDPAAVPALKEALKGYYADVAVNAAWALAEIGDKSALPAMEAVHKKHEDDSGCKFCGAISRLKSK